MNKEDISCPICGETFLNSVTEKEINQHIDWCLTQVYLRESAIAEVSSTESSKPSQTTSSTVAPATPKLPSSPMLHTSTTTTPPPTTTSTATQSPGIFARAFMETNSSSNNNNSSNNRSNSNSDAFFDFWNSDEEMEEQPEDEEKADDEEDPESEEDEEDEDDSEEEEEYDQDSPFLVRCPYHKTSFPHRVCGKKMEARLFPAHVFDKHRDSLSHAYACPICQLFHDTQHYRVNKGTNLLTHLERSHYELRYQGQRQQQQQRQQHQKRHHSQLHNRNKPQQHINQPQQTQTSYQSIPQKPKPQILRASSLELNPPGSTHAYAKQYITDPMVGIECSICYEEFQPEEIVARMECLCVYHVVCIERWFKIKEKQCPLHSTA